MAKFNVTVTLVVEHEEEDAAGVSRWFKQLIDMQGDDQMRIRKRSVRTTEQSNTSQEV